MYSNEQIRPLISHPFTQQQFPIPAVGFLGPAPDPRYSPFRGESPSPKQNNLFVSGLAIRTTPSGIQKDIGSFVEPFDLHVQPRLCDPFCGGLVQPNFSAYFIISRIPAYMSILDEITFDARGF